MDFCFVSSQMAEVATVDCPYRVAYGGGLNLSTPISVLASLGGVGAAIVDCPPTEWRTAEASI